MMRHLLTWLMASYVLVALAQPAGRYVHKALGYTLTYVVVDSKVGIELDVPGEAPFVEPPVYPLKGGDDDVFTVEGAYGWYREISLRLPEAEIVEGSDLIKLWFPFGFRLIIARFEDQPIRFDYRPST